MLSGTVSTPQMWSYLRQISIAIGHGQVFFGLSDGPGFVHAVKLCKDSYICSVMATLTDSPQVKALLIAVEKKFGRPVRTPADFTALADLVQASTGEHLSDSTVKRLWKPNLSYPTVATHTVNLLSRYAGYSHFNEFCLQLAEKGIIESELVPGAGGIRAEGLTIGTLVRIAWMPDRECTLCYLGNNRFQAVETSNSTLQPGDTFSCSTLIPGRPLYVDNLHHGGKTFEQYAMGTAHGLTRVEILDQQT